MSGAPGSAVPQLRPEAGFVIKSEEEKPRPGFVRPACWYVNFTKHALVGMPLTPNGQPTNREHLLSRGLGNLQVPLDLGSFRKLKEAAEGGRRITYCIDVVFNPFVITMFMDDEFCTSMDTFRAYVIGLAFKNIERELRRKLSENKVTLVKAAFYKDGLGRKADTPRDFADLAGGIEDEVSATAQSDIRYKASEAASDPGITLKTSKSVEPAGDGKPLIEECDAAPASSGGRSFDPPARKKGPAVKKGFLNNTKGKLYGEEGSKEGVLPENAGDPLGYLPKGLRKACNVVDCNAPEYRKHEEQRQAAERQNEMSSEFSNMLSKDMASYNNTVDKWQEDKPIGDEPTKTKARYDNDYSRFTNLEEEPEAPEKPESRDWYFDENGNRKNINTNDASKSSAAKPPTADAGTGAAVKGPGKPAVKRGFLKDTKGSIYGEEGSTQGGAAIDPEKQRQVIEELSRKMLSGDPEEARKIAEILGTDGKDKEEDAAAKMAELLQATRKGNNSTSDSSSTSPKSRAPAPAGGSDAEKSKKANAGEAALGMLQEMISKTKDGNVDSESAGQMLGDMIENLKGLRGPGSGEQMKATWADKNMDEEMKAVQEMLGAIDAHSGAGSSAAPRSGMDAPDRSGASSTTTVKQPVHRIEKDEEGAALRLVVEVPGLTSMKDVGLDVSERLTSLSFPEDTGLEALHAQLPSAVIPTGARAKFSKKTKTLTVTMPLAGA